MDSVQVKAVEQPPVQVVSGPFKVVSITLRIQTDRRVELYNLTDTVRQFVREAGIRAGSVMVSSLHTTNAILINEWQDALLHDIKTYLESLISRNGAYRHNDPEWSDCDRHNADSHLRAMVLGTHISLPVGDCDVVLGEWQSIIMAELDGPRERLVRLQVMGVTGD